MLSVALDRSASVPLGDLLAYLARSGDSAAVAAIVRLLACRRAFVWGDIAPAVERLCLNESPSAVLEVISEAISHLRLRPGRDALDLGEFLKTILIDGDEAASFDPSVLAGIAWSARATLDRSGPRPSKSHPNESLLSLAERVGRKLELGALTPPPPERPPLLAWPSRDLAFSEFEAQWTASSGIVVEWLQSMSVGTPGERCDRVVRTKLGQDGHAIYGPYFRLPEGHYRV